MSDDAPLKPLSLAAYGKSRGVTGEAVRKAVQSGRLSRSVVMVRGKPKITDPEIADLEWSANTRGPHTGSPAPPLDPTVPDAAIDYAEARRRREVELWRQAAIKTEGDALDLAEKKREVIPVADARAAVIDEFTVVRTKLLGLATRCKQRLPELTVDGVRVIDSLVREALEELDGDDGAE